MTKQFEIGPIRPPSEAGSLLLRITRNCPWNKCKFCTLYRKHKFSTRPIEEIKADIDQVAQYRENILSGEIKDLRGLPDETAERYMYLSRWISGGEESVFLQDGNTTVLSFEKLRDILAYLREKLPSVKRVTSYGRADSLNKFTAEQMAELKAAGLDRIHCGYETGSDKVLLHINKGYTKAQQIEAGRKVKAAGIELSVYYMPGVGGKELSDENALETADMINKVNPDFVRIRTFVTQKRTELQDDIDAGRMTQCTDKEKAQELKKMIEYLTDADGHLHSDHIINLFEDVNGNMKTDKERILSVFEDFERLNTADQRRYQVARRMGMMGSLSHMELLSAGQLDKIDEYIAHLDSEEEFEDFLTKLLRRYV